MQILLNLHILWLVDYNYVIIYGVEKIAEIREAVKTND